MCYYVVKKVGCRHSVYRSTTVKLLQLKLQHLTKLRLLCTSCGTLLAAVTLHMAQMAQLEEFIG